MEDQSPQEPQESKLTPKQRKFVDAYVGEARGNGTRAAELAGYAANSEDPKKRDNVWAQVARENLRLPQIADAVKERVSQYALSPEQVLAAYADIALNSSIKSFMHDDEGAISFHLRDETGEYKDAVRFIKSMRVTGGLNPSISIEVYDRTTALDRLAKFHGLTPDKLNLHIEDIESKTDDELRDIARGKTPGRS